LWFHKSSKSQHWKEIDIDSQKKMRKSTNIWNPTKIDGRILTSGLRYVILKAGEGNYPEIKQKVSVHYTGKLLDEKVFDTSPGELAKESGLFNEGMSYEPYQFTLGTGSVIQGWDIGIVL